MKNIVTAAFVVGIAAFGMLSYGYFRATPGPAGLAGFLPVIEVSPEFFDFGDVAYGDLAEYVFIIKNTGDAPLEIKRISTSCACTTAKAATQIILPGQQTELTVSYNTGAMSGPHGMGEQDRIIYIQSNDPNNSQTEIIIHARVY